MWKPNTFVWATCRNDGQPSASSSAPARSSRWRPSARPRTLRAAALAALATLGGIGLPLAAVAGPERVRDAAGTAWQLSQSDEGDETWYVERSIGGALDGRFGAAGRAPLAIGIDAGNPTALRIDAVGRVWAGGTADDAQSEPVVLRLLPGGQPDPAWGQGGRRPVPPGSMPATLEDLLPMPDGSAWVAGHVETEDGDEQAGLWRLRPDGTLDGAFAGRGLWSRPGADGARVLALGSGGGQLAGLALSLVEGADTVVEVYDNRASPTQFALVLRERTLPGHYGQYHLRWDGTRWRVEPGREEPVLAAAVDLGDGAAPAAAATAEAGAGSEPGGLAGMSPFAPSADTAASAPATEEDGSYAWAAAAGAAVMAIGWLLLRRRDGGR